MARASLEMTRNKLGHSVLCRSVFTASHYDHPLPRYSYGIRAMQTNFLPFLKVPFSHVTPMARTLARAEGAPVAARYPNFNTTFSHAHRNLVQNFMPADLAVFELLPI